MLHDDWLDIPCVVVLRSFCFKPRMVSEKNIRRNIFTIIFLCSFHKGITAKGENSCYLPKVFVLGQKAYPWETFELCFKLVKWFPLQHQSLFTYLKIYANNSTRSTIFMINKCVYNHPFKVFMNREYEGVEDLICGNVGETNWFRSFLAWAWIWWGVHELASMLVDLIFLFKLQGWFFMKV